MGVTPVLAIADEAGLLQHAEMLRHRGLRDSGPDGQGADGLLTFAAQPLEDRAAGRIGERPEDDVVRVGHADR